MTKETSAAEETTGTPARPAPPPADGAAQSTKEANHDLAGPVDLDNKGFGSVPNKGSTVPGGVAAGPSSGTTAGGAERGPENEAAEQQREAHITTLGAKLARMSFAGVTRALDALPALKPDDGTHFFAGDGHEDVEPPLHFCRTGARFRRQAHARDALPLTDVWRTPLCFDQPHQLELFEQTLRGDVGWALLCQGARRGARYANGWTTWVANLALQATKWTTQWLNCSATMTGTSAWARLPREAVGLLAGVACFVVFLGAGVLYGCGLAIGSVVGGLVGFLHQLFVLFQLPSETLDQLQQALPDVLLQKSEQRYGAALANHFYDAMAEASALWLQRPPRNDAKTTWTLEEMAASRSFATQLDRAVRSVTLLAGRAGSADQLANYLLGTARQRQFYEAQPLDGDSLLPCGAANDARGLLPHAVLRNEPRAPLHPRRPTRKSEEPPDAPPDEPLSPQAFDSRDKALAWYSAAYVDKQNNLFKQLGLPDPEGDRGQSYPDQDKGLRAIFRLGSAKGANPRTVARERLGQLLQEVYDKVRLQPAEEAAKTDLLREVRGLVEVNLEEEGTPPPTAA